MKLFAFIFLFTNLVSAAVYNCTAQENFSIPHKMQITIPDHQRVLVRSDWTYSFYLATLGNGLVELEAFLPAVEMRIYSKGNIEKNSVTLTSWQRDGLVELSCSLGGK